MQRHRIICSACGLETSHTFWIALVRFRIVLHCSHLFHSAEQECHLLNEKVYDPHFLDQEIGQELQTSLDGATYAIETSGTRSCSYNKNLTKSECTQAMHRLLGPQYNPVTQNVADRPTGCYRETANTDSWLFNEYASGTIVSSAQPVCDGNAKQGCLFAYNSFSHFACLCCRILGPRSSKISSAFFYPYVLCSFTRCLQTM